jgi:hypothetical protein
MGIAIHLAAEFDTDRSVDLLLPSCSSADRGMGIAIDQAAEIDRDRSADLLLPPRSTADRGMGIAIAATTHREPRHV